LSKNDTEVGINQGIVRKDLYNKHSHVDTELGSIKGTWEKESN